MTAPFQLWGQPLRQIEIAAVGHRTLVVAVGGPPGREARVFDAVDGHLVAEYSIGTWRIGPRWPYHVFGAGNGARLAIGINHHSRPLPELVSTSSVSSTC
jgi:hypothetical protein